MGKRGHPSPNKGKSNLLFWLCEHVVFQGDECLIWPFFRDDEGYGLIPFNGKTQRANRVMCRMAKGEPPTNRHQVAHTCGNGRLGCINPKHLVWKTNSENQRDRKIHGTHVSYRGGSAPRITAEQIRYIREESGKKNQRTIARDLGVSLGCVQYWLGIRERRGVRRPEPTPS